jgi:hypothetical protein
MEIQIQKEIEIEILEIGITKSFEVKVAETNVVIFVSGAC